MSDPHRHRPLAVLAAALLAGVALLVAGIALAEPPPRGGHPGRLASLVASLGLDDATQRAVEQVLAEAHAERREGRPARREGHRRLRALLEADAPDEAAIFAQLDELAALELEARKRRIRTLLRVRELLPPEARARLVEAMERGREGRKAGRGRHGFHGRDDSDAEEGAGVPRDGG